MTDRMMTALRGLTMAAGLLMLGAGCEPKGPAEKAGEAIDSAADDVKETIDPSGPGEKAGEALDDAAKEISNP